MKKKLAVLLGCTMITATLTACGSGQNSAATSATDAKAPNQKTDTTSDMIVSWWGNQTRNERTQQVLEIGRAHV